MPTTHPRPASNLRRLYELVSKIQPDYPVGRICHVTAKTVDISGLAAHAAIGDRIKFLTARKRNPFGEVIRLSNTHITALYDSPEAGLKLGEKILLLPPARLAPDYAWLGRVIDPLGQPLDGKAILPGLYHTALDRPAPPAAERRGFGERLETGACIFNTALPIVRGQRLGLFAGSGVGKSKLLAHLAQHLQADIIIVALIGERGREVGEFVKTTLGPTALARSVVVAATSDMSPLLRQKTAQSAMSIAEYFRDQGLQVAYFADSITRFAEAYREVALSAGELPALRGYPASLAHSLMALCERAGPGCAGMGDITALFSVLVPGSDMEDPVADILRGVLDGHVVLSRAIAERGRFPAIDLLRSVSRALPVAASPEENHALRVMRAILGAYEAQEPLIKAGLYEAGTDPLIEDAIKVWPALDRFIGAHEAGMIQDSFEQLFEILRQTQSNALL